jgi:YVTN family beta-propeller protein
VDLNSFEVVRRMPVPPGPSGLAVWGEFLYVTHFWSGDLSLVYLPQGTVVRSVSTGIDTGISQAVDIDVQRAVAFLPQTRSNTLDEYATFDTTVFPVINVLDLRDMTMEVRQRIALSAADRPVNMPFGVVVDRFRNFLYVTNAGSNDVSVIDLDTGLARANIPVGSNPRGLLLNRDNTYLFVHNVIDGSLTIIDTGSLSAIDVLPISNPVISNDIIIGAELFHSAADPRLSEDRWISCATCHFDGQPDGRSWLSLSAGPRNTPPLFNLIETAPYTWTGAWDELQDVELKIRRLQAGTGLIEDFPLNAADSAPHAGLSFDLDLLAAYLLSLTPPQNPNVLSPERMAQGAALFESLDCAACHAGSSGTDLQQHDVGTGPPTDNGTLAYDTPSLRYLWLSAPYFHDGSAATLRDILTRPGVHEVSLERSDMELLIEYLLAWS